MRATAAGTRMPVAGAVGVQQSWTEDIAIGDTRIVLDTVNRSQARSVILWVRCIKGVAQVTISQSMPFATRPITFGLGTGCAAPVRCWAGCIVTATAGTQASATLQMALLEGPIDDVPPVDAWVGGLVVGGVGVPGAWSSLGWQPPERPVVSIFSVGDAEFCWQDEGNTILGLFSVAGSGAPPVGRMIHPPRMELFARHPGDANLPVARGALAAWMRD